MQATQCHRDILRHFDRDRRKLKKSLNQADPELLEHVLNVQHLVMESFRAFLAREETHKPSGHKGGHFRAVPRRLPQQPDSVAERGGFEPPKPFRVYTLSGRALKRLR